MSNRIHGLAQQLTGKQNLEDCSLEEVKQIAQRYPYFAPAQFLLLQKLRQSSTAEEADVQYKKAVLFYPNPLQFEFFISSAKFYEERIETPQYEATTLPALEEETAATSNEEQIATTETPATFEQEEQRRIPEAFLIETSEEVVHTEDTEPEENLLLAEEAPAISDAQDETANLIETKHISPATEERNESLQTTPPLAFEPYHTVDYFASQGIKISSDELPKDKLGKGLKSFTEWLKTMKRLPAAQLAESPETTAEKGVETLADRSVSDSEVLTEAMAEVWVKQGAPQKALDIYNKLLLHDPSKKTYFAAKIENLKQS